MYSRIKSAVCQGLSSSGIEIETHILQGLPHHSIVGLPSAVIKESKERVRAALNFSDAAYPDDHIIQNLIPACEKKEGSQLDLPLAVGIYCAISGASVGDVVFLGELSLEGRLKTVSNLVTLILACRSGECVVLPSESRKEAELVDFCDIEFAFYDDLRSLLSDISGNKFAAYARADTDGEVEETTSETPDFSDLRGQREAIRLLQIAAAGGFHTLISGPPGCGKSMMASRFSGLLPEPTRHQVMEICKVHGVRTNFARPVRTPHHSITRMGLIGGGASLNLGEISKAHGGVLVLDEFGEYKKDVMELLREPLETRCINLSRASKSVVLPADFQLIATMNPCACGGYMPGRHSMNCTCTKLSLERYYGKLTWPLVDRMGLYIFMDKVAPSDVASKSTGELKQEVAAAIAFGERYGDYSERVSDSAMRRFEQMLDKNRLSQRARGIMLKVAECMANFEESEEINFEHLLGAIQVNPSFRLMDLRK